MLRLFSISSSTNPRNGFLLLELGLALALSGLLAMQVQRAVMPLLHHWRTLQIQRRLDQAQRYMFNQLEYELAYNGSQLLLDQENQQLSCLTLNAQRQLIYKRQYVNNNYGLYLTIRNANGTSKLPLYIPDCQLHSWKAEILQENQLYLELVLEHKQHRERFGRVITLLNGTVRYE